MLTCKEASLLTSQGLNQRLGLRERLSLMIHLFMCDACMRFRRQLDFLRRAARRADEEAGEGTSLPPEIRARIAERLRSHM